MKITLLTGKTFELEKEFPFPLKVVRSRRSRRLTLRIDSKKREAVLTMPGLCTQKKAWQFVREHQQWVEQKLAEIPVARDFEDGKVISLLGQEVVIRHNAQSLSAAHLTGGVLEVGGQKAFLHRRVKDFIKRCAREELLRRSRLLAAKIGCTVENVAVKDTISRWGSCSTLNNINYNWRIALAPECVIDYLTAHEVAHLRHHDHSPEFWRCVQELCPQSAAGRLWLKMHGRELYLYR